MSQTPVRFAGYAGLFDIPDASADIIRKGAFLQTLGARGEPLPLLWQHNPRHVIGEIENAGEDERGLRVVARIDAPNARGPTMLLNKQVSGLSFGYRAREYRRNEDGRELLGIDLFEVSLVTHPLQHGARVHFVH